MGRKPYNTDLTGKRFGLLVVEEMSDKVTYTKRGPVHLWKCKCDCEAIVYKCTSHLNYNKNNGCRECMKKHRIARANEGAGFVKGTQLSKIQNIPTESHRNKSGIRGVYEQKGRWRARLQFQGKNYDFGTYNTIPEATAARKAGEKEIYDKFLATLNSN